MGKRGVKLEHEFVIMMRRRRIAIFFAVLFVLSIGAIIGTLVFMNSGDYSGSNENFGVLSARDGKESKTYVLQEFNDVYFFSQDFASELTLFTDAIPNLKIVNSDKYTVEVKSNKQVLDNLQVFNEENGKLIFGFDKELYGVLSGDNGYYRGLYVECDLFEVTINAPVDHFRTHAEINLDFDAPKSDTLVIDVDGEIRQGTVKNIDSLNLVASFCGNTNITMSGTVSKMSDITARHNSKVDAEELKCPKLYSLVTCQIFGFSYINQGDESHYSITGAGFVIALLLILLPIACVVMFVLFWKKFLKSRKHMDMLIEKERSEQRILKIPPKN